MSNTPNWGAGQFINIPANLSSANFLTSSATKELDVKYNLWGIVVSTTSATTTVDVTGATSLAVVVGHHNLSYPVKILSKNDDSTVLIEVPETTMFPIPVEIVGLNIVTSSAKATLLISDRTERGSR